MAPAHAHSHAHAHAHAHALPPAPFAQHHAPQHPQHPQHPQQQQQHPHPHQHPHQQSPYPPHPMLPPASAAQAYPQPIAPAPPRDRRPDFAPFAAAVAPDLPPNPAQFIPKERTQVVGTQGRRGILPSVPGRAAVANGANGASKASVTPAKDADGKFPCPHCNKTYLHAKHLKRHLLRHTGDRPYMCVLCKDTFSRSDILKRHFQKCSLRRGNPTGVSHLSHPHAHLKRAQAAGIVPKPVQATDVASSFASPSGLVATTFGEPSVNGVSVAPAQQPRFADHHHLGYPMHAAAANGMNRGPPDHGFAHPQHQQPPPHHARAHWMAADQSKPNHMLMQPGPDGVGQLNHVDLPPIDGNKPPANAPATSLADKRPPVSAAGGPNGTSNHNTSNNNSSSGGGGGGGGGGNGDIDWSTMLQPGSHENYMTPGVFPSTMAPPPDALRQHLDGGERGKFYGPTTTTAATTVAAMTNGHPGESGGLNGLYLASTSLGGDGTSGLPPRLKV
ncbi:hypothetical protein LOZ16_006561 [Ophidiomyces ophidiicola]|nr:hypothetical protein LOZ16_006561 [Ophidiomyces ophidiicola]KAI2300011.1 hypothetical protein LOY99_006518 [Ophidiomyces ophidiicola]